MLETVPDQMGTGPCPWLQHREGGGGRARWGHAAGLWQVGGKNKR